MGCFTVSYEAPGLGLADDLIFSFDRNVKPRVLILLKPNNLLKIMYMFCPVGKVGKLVALLGAWRR